jgi:hypothetical protein
MGQLISKCISAPFNFLVYVGCLCFCLYIFSGTTFSGTHLINFELINYQFRYNIQEHNLTDLTWLWHLGMIIMPWQQMDRKKFPVSSEDGWPHRNLLVEMWYISLYVLHNILIQYCQLIRVLNSCQCKKMQNDQGSDSRSTTPGRSCCATCSCFSVAWWTWPSS